MPTISPTPAPTHSLICPDGWVAGVDEECYLQVPYPLTFTACAAHCANQDASKLCVESEQQNSLLYSLRSGEYRWLGLYQEGAGSFLWVDGCASNFALWEDGDAPTGMSDAHGYIYANEQGLWWASDNPADEAYCVRQGPAISCPEGWVRSPEDDQCYLLATESAEGTPFASWDHCDAYCAANSAHLPCAADDRTT